MEQPHACTVCKACTVSQSVSLCMSKWSIYFVESKFSRRRRSGRPHYVQIALPLSAGNASMVRWVLFC